MRLAPHFPELQIALREVRLLHELRRLLLNTKHEIANSSGRTTAYVALAAVCLLWGTTYLAIRISVETIPPLYLIGIRYTISGGILIIGGRLAGAHVPGGRELLQTALCGVSCIGLGNGLLVVAETWVPSGLAALFYTTAPFWMVGLDAVLPGGRKPLRSTLAGLLAGLCGVVFLILPAVLKESLRGATFAGFLLLQVSVCFWVAGALLQKQVAAKARPFMTGAVQQLAAGIATLVPAMAFEHLPHAVSNRSAWGFVYLVIVGSLIGFSAFIYAVAQLPVAIVSVYTFVNPVVAVLLGWLIAGESFGYREILSMLIIFAGIAIVRRSESRREKTARVPEGAVGEMEAIGPEP